MNDLKNYYQFLISGNGYYCYSKFNDGKFIALLTWRESKFINKYNSNNKLTIRRKGNRIEFLINDYLVDKTKFEKPMGSKIGYTVVDKQNIEIENIIVWKLL